MLILHERIVFVYTDALYVHTEQLKHDYVSPVKYWKRSIYLCLFFDISTPKGAATVKRPPLFSVHVSTQFPMPGLKPLPLFHSTQPPHFLGLLPLPSLLCIEKHPYSLPFESSHTVTAEMKSMITYIS